NLKQSKISLLAYLVGVLTLWIL
ncbi:hypothetical protein MJO28_014470, partial [Puccinia striiformis f. sp. tritici]